MTGRRVRRPTLFSLWRKARRENSAASRLLGSTSLRFALHGWQRRKTLITKMTTIRRGTPPPRRLLRTLPKNRSPRYRDTPGRGDEMIRLSCREIARQAGCSREIVSRSIQYLVERHLLKRDGHALLVPGLRLEQEPGTNGKLQLSWPKAFRDSCKALYHSNRRQSIKRHQRVKAAPGRRSRGHAHACC